jgi:hypothetical protein
MSFPFSRTVGAGIHIVALSDVNILCDTSAGAINLILPKIIDAINFSQRQGNGIGGFGSGNFTLNIVDIGNNAASNNITIVKNSADTFSNNLSSLVINTNRGSLGIKPIDNNLWYVNKSEPSSSGGAISLTTTGTSGASTLIGNVLNIPIYSDDNNLITKTREQALVLKNAGQLKPLKFYLISNASTLYYDDKIAGIIIQAISTTEFSKYGTGYFYTPNFINSGSADYSSSPITFSGNLLGVWSDNFPSVIIGDVCVWDNYNYINKTGVNDITDPSVDSVNWEFLSPSKTTGYFKRVNSVIYDISSDTILSRTDDIGNYVENNFSGGSSQNPLLTFQWGNPKCFSNTIIGSSKFEGMNSWMPFYSNFIDNAIYTSLTNYSTEVTNGNFSFNTISNGFEVEILKECYTQIQYNNFSGFKEAGILKITAGNRTSLFATNTIKGSTVRILTLLNDAEFYSNTIVSCPQIDINTIAAGSNLFNNNNISSSAMNINIVNNNFEGNTINSSNIVCYNSINQLFQGNTFNSSEFIATNVNAEFKFNKISGNICYLNITSNQENKVLIGDYSTFELPLNMSDPAIYDAGTKTLTLSDYHSGVIILSNCGGNIIEYLQVDGACIKAPQVDRKYIPALSQTVTFRNTPIATAVTDQLVCNAPVGDDTITQNTEGTNSITYGQSSGLYIRKSLLIAG